MFPEKVGVGQLEVRACVCVCWGGGVTFPSEGCMFNPKALRSHLQKCGLSSQDEDSTQRGQSVSFADGKPGF